MGYGIHRNSAWNYYFNLDYILEKKGTSFRLHLMPIAVGMYLPFGLSTPILLGGFMAYFIQKQNKTDMNSEDLMQNGILVSSGLIAGESPWE